MSWTLVRLVWERYPADKAKPALLALADQARSDDGSNCYPSLNTIAFYAGCKVSQARRHVRDLERRGFVRALADGRDGGNPLQGRQYCIMVEALEALPKLSKVLKDSRSTPSTRGRGNSAATPSISASLPLPSEAPTPSISDGLPLPPMTAEPKSKPNSAFKGNQGRAKSNSEQRGASFGEQPIEKSKGNGAKTLEEHAAELGIERRQRESNESLIRRVLAARAAREAANG